MSRKAALITSITGQDGSYLAEFLPSKDYVVHGIKRQAPLFNRQRVDGAPQHDHRRRVERAETDPNARHRLATQFDRTKPLQRWQYMLSSTRQQCQGQ